MKSSLEHERRKSERIKGKREAILVNPNGMHTIRDISKSGLRFSCSETDFFPGQWPIEIVYAGTSLYLRGVQVRFIREEIMDGDTLISNPTKEVGVEFINLDDKSSKLLEQLLALHTRGVNH